MKNDLSKRADKAKAQDVKYREMPDIVVKVVCRYRAELYFKISRKTKFSRLFNAWGSRMERAGGSKDDLKGLDVDGSSMGQTNGSLPPSNSTMQFIFTHNGRTVEADQTPEEIGMDEGDELLAVELMDLTEGGSEIWVGGI